MYNEKAISTLQALVLALGAGLAIWGIINLLEGYENNIAKLKSQGMEQILKGADIAKLSFEIPALLTSTTA